MKEFSTSWILRSKYLILSPLSRPANQRLQPQFLIGWILDDSLHNLGQKIVGDIPLQPHLLWYVTVLRTLEVAEYPRWRYFEAYLTRILLAGLIDTYRGSGVRSNTMVPDPLLKLQQRFLRLQAETWMSWWIDVVITKRNVHLLAIWSYIKPMNRQLRAVDDNISINSIHHANEFFWRAGTGTRWNPRVSP
jgi:hypothetical protein